MKLEDFINRYSVCLITDNDHTSGTGFCASKNDKMYLVTDCHVVYNKNNNNWYSQDFVLKFLNQDTDLMLQPLFRLELAGSMVYMAEDLDLCIIEINADNTTKENGSVELVDLTCLPLTNVEIADCWAKDVYFCGVPSSLRIEAPFDSKPLISKGIISAYDNSEGRFVTDIPVYYGNSGSPAFSVDEDGTLKLLGIVQQLVQFNLEWKNRYETDMTRMDWHNSGYSICRSVNKIIELIETGHATQY